MLGDVLGHVIGVKPFSICAAPVSVGLGIDIITLLIIPIRFLIRDMTRLSQSRGTVCKVDGALEPGAGDICGS